MSGRPLEGAELRAIVLAAAAFVALASSTSWSLEWASGLRTGSGMTLDVTGHRRGKSTPLADVIPAREVELRFSGTVPRPCHVFLVVITPRSVDVMGEGGFEGLGVRAGPGPYRIPGGRFVEALPGEAVRFVAVCGPSTLDATQVKVAAWSAQQQAGGDPSAAALLDELPEGTLQVSRVLTGAPM